MEQNKIKRQDKSVSMIKEKGADRFYLLLFKSKKGKEKA